MTWKTTLSFIISATLLIVLSGWLIEANMLPMPAELSYSEAEQNFVQIWLQIAIVIGLFALCGVTLIANLQSEPVAAGSNRMGTAHPT